MEHHTQIRKVPESNTAVLLVHGILGTPHQFDFLLPVIPESWTTVNLLLPGHGGKVEDFGKSSMQAWEACAAEQVENLCAAYENVFILAHSMGTLFAVDAAIKHPDRVRGLFLLAPPLRLHVKPMHLLNTMKVGLGFAREDDPTAAALLRAYSLQPDRRVWKYLRWVPRYLELFRKIAKTGKKLPQLKTPTEAFLSQQDEMVSVRTAQLLTPCPTVHVTVLPGSTHYAYSDEDAACLRERCTAFLKR